MLPLSSRGGGLSISGRVTNNRFFCGIPYSEYKLIKNFEKKVKTFITGIFYLNPIKFRNIFSPTITIKETCTDFKFIISVQRFAEPVDPDILAGSGFLMEFDPDHDPVFIEGPDPDTVIFSNLVRILFF